jgi:hypothetical protein
MVGSVPRQWRGARHEIRNRDSNFTQARHGTRGQRHTGSSRSAPCDCNLFGSLASPPQKFATWCPIASWMCAEGYSLNFEVVSPSTNVQLNSIVGVRQYF